ncbi:MAG: toll/interleukin-1 receptor domain-containing protein [Planctomycetota bacterium]
MGENQHFDTLFISHANPSDNALTIWLASRLTQLGYKVWADVVHLKGGAYTWRDIEDVLRTRASRVLYLFSHKSKDAPGVLDELELARSLQRDRGREFIIPIRVDDTSYQALPVGITGKNALNFEGGWAQGLRELLDTLETNGVPRSNTSESMIENTWLKATAIEHAKIVSQPSRLWTNFLELAQLPTIYTFEHDNFRGRPIGELRDSFVHIRRGRFVFTFASPKFIASEGTHFALKEIGQHKLGELDVHPTLRSNPRHLEKDLLAKTWLCHLRHSGWPTLQFSSQNSNRHRSSVVFTPAYFGKAKIRSQIESVAHGRVLNGYRGMTKGAVRRWAYGLELLTEVDVGKGFWAYPRVVAYADGEDDHTKWTVLQSQRNTVTKGWHNDRARDVLLVAIEALANGKPTLDLQTGSDQVLSLKTLPVTLTAPFDFEILRHADAAPIQISDAEDE